MLISLVQTHCLCEHMSGMCLIYSVNSEVIRARYIQCEHCGVLNVFCKSLCTWKIWWARCLILISQTRCVYYFTEMTSVLLILTLNPLWSGFCVQWWCVNWSIYLRVPWLCIRHWFLSPLLSFDVNIRPRWTCFPSREVMAHYLDLLVACKYRRNLGSGLLRMFHYWTQCWRQSPIHPYERCSVVFWSPESSTSQPWDKVDQAV